ncbi:MAG: HD domain-containing protein [Lentisphaerae bacterium]|nr:HD domain-containing protein [Lentisphaerota bacterium]
MTEASPIQTPPPDGPALAALARAAVERLQKAGHTAYWAGGCVRDRLLGRMPKDYDIATNALPDTVIALFPRAIAVGKAFGVVRVPVEDAWFEIATFRQDHDYQDGRRPTSVTFADARMDAERRDFTINALFYDPIADRFLDYVGGRDDLQARLIRAVGDPARRFLEDHLRLLRAVRFAHTLEFALEAHTADAIRLHAGLVANVSEERVRDELARILVESKRPGDALRALDDLGLLAPILPEVSALKHQAQPPAFHPEGDVFTHTVIMLNLMESPSLPLAFSILLHDIGKPPTATLDGDRIRFNRHAAVGADMAEEILRRLRFSNDEITTIVEAVRSHMRFVDVPHMKRSTLRALVGRPNFPLELELHRIDCLSSHNVMDTHERITAFQQELASEPALPPPWITGRDLMGLGIPEGPAVGAWLRRAYEAQLEGSHATRDALWEWLKGEIARGTP